MKENSDYCGFLCSEIIDRQEALINDIYEFARVNPEFALTMLDKIVRKSYDARRYLASKIDNEIVL
jgi:hypothetical protein